MKIVILDGYTLNPGDLSWKALEAMGDLTVYDRTSPEDIVKRIGDAEIVFTNKTPLAESTFNACPNIEFVGVLATGYNVVDVNAAGERSIPVCNVPTYGTTSVAQFVFALILELCHHVGHHSQAVTAGKWSSCADFCFWDYPLIELSGKTMGIVGAGKIGMQTATIAQAFGMNVIAFDTKQVDSNVSDTFRYGSLDEVYTKSDIISLHVPLFDSTIGMINRESISKMKKGVMIINTSRGPLIVEEDLKEALISGKVAGAGVDVVSTEPIEMNNVLLNVPNMIITPHIAWAPLEARARLMEVAVSNLSNYLDGKITNSVNL